MLLPSFLASVLFIGIGVEAQTTSARTSTTTRARTTSVPSTSTSTSTTSSVAAATHTVAVGADGFKFQPNRITAEKGDTVLFRFYPGGHAVARSDFGLPCIPYELTGVNHVGFFSKIQTPHVVSNDLPTFSIKINDTQPIFFYCSAPGSCVDHHMIGAINPNSTQTLEKQEEAVRKASQQLTPGDAWPSETARPTTPTAGAAGGQQEAPALGPGQIAGIAIGGAAALALVGALLFICGRRSGRGLLPWSKEDGGAAAAAANPPTPRLGEGGTPLAANAAPLDVKQQQQHQQQHVGTLSSPGHSPFATTVSPYSAAAIMHDPYRAAGVAHHPYHPRHYQNVVAPPPPPSHAGGRTPPYSPGSFLTYQPISGYGPQHQQYMPHHGASVRSAPNWAAPRPGAHGAHELPPPTAPVELSAAPRSPGFQVYQQSRQFSYSHNSDRGFTPGPRP
ncbi:hypothetical protein RB594_009200 [Gaeumannomyces avenae]